MKSNIKKIISIFLLICLVVSNLPLGAIIAAYVRPSVSISAPDKSSVSTHGTVTYTVYYSDADYINLSSSYVTLNGFSANISISGTGNSRNITLSNIEGSAGSKSIGIKAGSAQNSVGSSLSVQNTIAFNLVNQTNNNVDKVRPSITVSEPSNNKVYNGGTLTYTVVFADNKAVNRINLSSSYVVLNGFTAKVSITGKGLNRLITLSNVQGSAGKKSISIKAGAAEDASGNTTLATSNSMSFELVNNSNNKNSNVNTNTKSSAKSTSSATNRANSSSKSNVSIKKDTGALTVNASKVIKSTPKIVNGCEDSLTVLGDINKEVKTFSTWFTSEKNKFTYAQQNNYVAKDEIVTYFVDYYNGNENDAKNVSIKLNIPYNVDVLEINGNGHIDVQNSSETAILWDKGTVKYGEKCRLYVKVKYLENVLLQNSDKISETFYINLNTKYDNKSEDSYLKQLYIDYNSNKTATIEKYLSRVDNTNSIRPDDKITRAELAKMLVDVGIVEVKQGNTNYKKYKDAEEIPSYAREAVSALYNTGIIDAFEDGEFKPNNPIVRDEFFRIVAKASEYMSNGKLKIKTPTFIYTDIISDKDRTMTVNKNYIMELIRQNIIKKENTNSDEYTLRKEAAEVINSLTFRGPYVDKLPQNAVKFTDISKDSKYFYNIIGATNTYTYNYTNNLLQQIISVK